MMDHLPWWQPLLSTQAPALPQTWAMQLATALGWALVLALLATVLAARLALPRRRLLAAALALWALLPGPWSAAYWLGLAFQAPSLAAMLLCLAQVARGLWPGADVAVCEAPPRARWSLLAAVLLGYVLLLDSFAVLPVQVYAWGFSPLLLLLLLAASLCPWLLAGAGAPAPGVWLAPLALLLFAATRLPTGNVWDAVLDPWLWLVLQGAWVRRWFAR